MTLYDATTPRKDPARFERGNHFDQESVVAIGYVSVAPSNREIVWVGAARTTQRSRSLTVTASKKSTDGGIT
jgi:hypothetical protein